MTDRELLAQIQQQEAAAYSYLSDELAQQRADALDRYNVLPYGDEVEGRSSALSTDIRDTVEWAVPQLLKMFVGGDEVIKFDPKGPEDEEAAQQETDYINHVVLEKNNGFLVFNTWFRDALLQKNGYVKVWWEKKQDALIETYIGKTEEELKFLLEDEAVEPIQHSSYPDPFAQGAAQTAPPNVMQPQQLPMLHDVKVRRTRPVEYCRIECVPTEEVLVSKQARSVCIQDLDFIQHRVRRTLSDLTAEGYDTSVLEGFGDETELSTQEQARDLYAEEQDEIAPADPTMRKVVYKETYLRTDQNGDGVAELVKVCSVANVVLHKEEVDLIPFAAITPIVSPHRHIGVGFYDLLKQIQRIKTIILRQYLDNLYLQNNGRYGVDVNRVNVDDMLISRPGGLVRTNGDPNGAIFPLTHPASGQMALEGIQYLDAWSEKSTGVNAYQSVNNNALLRTATEIDQVTQAGQARLEGVARTFAETGIRELFLLVHAMTLKHSTREDKVRLRNKWVVIDPREWVRRDNLTVSAGLGSGTKTSKIQALQTLLQIQMSMGQAGLSNAQTMGETLRELVKEMGFKNTDKFVADPAQQPPPGPPPEVQIKQMELQGKMQLEQQKMQGDMQLQQHKAQTEVAQAQTEAQIKFDLEKYKADLDFQAKLRIAELEIAAQERMKAYEVQHRPVLTDGQNIGAQ